jgi:hypothetical protein
MGLLRRLLARCPACPEAMVNDQVAAQSVRPPSEEAIEQMSLAELNRLIDIEHRSLPQTVTIGFLAAIYRRAMEIAYHSHGTPNEDRTHAAIIARAMREGMLKGGQNEDLSPLRAAIAATEHRAKATGYGTLHWLLEERQVSPQKTIEFIMQPEHAHLLGGMLDTLKPDVRAGMRDGLVAELLRNRRVRNGDSVVFIAHGLAIANEPATVALFSAAELAALRNAHKDYGTARSVLSDLRFLPTQSSARGFDPQPPIALLAECVGLELHAEWWHAKEREPALPDFLSCSKEPWKTAFTTTSWLLCCHLALATVEQAYGAAAERALTSVLGEGLEKYNFAKTSEFSWVENWSEGIELLRDFSAIEKSAEEQSQNVDAALLLSQLKLFLGDHPQIPEAERDAFSSWFGTASRFLNQTRVRFLGGLRFSLRGLAEGYGLLGPNSSLDAIEVMNKGFENKGPALWEDVVLSPPFDYGGGSASPPFPQSLSSSS